MTAKTSAVEGAQHKRFKRASTTLIYSAQEITAQQYSGSKRRHRYQTPGSSQYWGTRRQNRQANACRRL